LLRLVSPGFSASLIRVTTLPVGKWLPLYSKPISSLLMGISLPSCHTTTTLVSSVLGAGGFDPTIVVGGRIENLGASARVGKGDFIVVEADESDGSFLTLSPAIAVVTNIDREHLDYYGGMDDLKSTFTDFLNKVPFYGLGIVGVDSQHVCSILPGLSRRFLTYGLSEDAELRAHDVTSSGFKTSFRVSLRGGELGTAVLTLPGRHNAQNALAAIAVGMELGMSFDQIKAGLGDWQRIERRLQVKGERCGVKIIDDYGHHPEEIRVTLQAVKDAFKPKRIIVVFQPHRYTRTKYLFDDFVKVLSKTDILYILDIYPAGESPIDGLSAELMCDAVALSGHRRVYFEPEFSRVIESVSEVLEPEDVVLTLGAGNVWKVAEGLVTTPA